MGPLRYLTILVLCVAATLPLEIWLGARVYRRPRRLLAAVVPVLVVFGTWDVVAAGRGDWSFSRRYTTGLRLGGLPVEEWLFFVVVPVCALLTFDVLGRRPARTGRPPAAGRSAAESRPARAERTSADSRPVAASHAEASRHGR